MKHTNYLSLLLVAGILAGCASGSPRQYPAPVYDENGAQNPPAKPAAHTVRRNPAPVYDGVSGGTQPAPVYGNQTGYNAPPVEQTPQTYRVQRGDTLYSIARKYNISRQDVVDLNDLDPEEPLLPGQVLVLPVDDNQRSAQPVVVLNKPTATVPTKTKPRVTRTGVINQPVDNGNNNAPQPTSRRERPGSTACPNPADENLKWVNPAEGELLSEFSETSNQKGLEIAGDFGDPVVAAADGEIVYSGTGLRGYGKLLLIKHNSTYITAYAHNRKLLVKLGDRVSQGQQIAEMGNTDASRVELYFELRKCGKAVDPRQYLPLN